VHVTHATWTAQADVLADVREIGDDIALLAGRCRATGLDPRSFAPIMGASMALGSRPWHIMDCPYDSDDELISDVLEHEHRLWQWQNAYIRLRSNIVHARAHAITMFNHAAGCKPPDTEEMTRWASVKADCDTALDVLAPLPAKLRAARNSLNRAPGELGETYQAVYDLLRQSQVMPYDGHFLTGEELPC
jgi:hypothetical protein